MSHRLLVSVRGPVEAIAAARGGAAIADVEYPASALGTPYPLNIHAVRQRLRRSGFSRVSISTNIGEHQVVRATACQAALGVATAGADFIKFGLAEQSLESAIYLGRNIVRTVRKWGRGKGLFPAVFIDDDMLRFFDPLVDGPKLAKHIMADGLLIDTFSKSSGKGLLDYITSSEIHQVVRAMHRQGREAWVAGSIVLEEMGDLWKAGVDVICVRGAACESRRGLGRFGEVTEDRVRALVDTIPK